MLTLWELHEWTLFKDRGDLCTKRGFLLGALGIHMDPLPVCRGISETVDTFLRKGQSEASRLEQRESTGMQPHEVHTERAGVRHAWVTVSQPEWPTSVPTAFFSSSMLENAFLASGTCLLASSCFTIAIGERGEGLSNSIIRGGNLKGRLTWTGCCCNAIVL